MFNIKEIVNLAFGIAAGMALGKILTNLIPTKAA